ncbi:MAG TPA: pectate lyase [Verrucomicrobiae bacterium]|nr:pectate lyase [Verrucomicrobiae bacterium]
MNFKLCLCSAAILAALSSPAAIIGTNTPSLPVNQARIHTLPLTQRAAWENYLKHSEQQRQADKDFFAAEMKAAGLTVATNAPFARGFGNVPLDEDAAWYAGTEARHIADVTVSFQTPAGGWSKHINLAGHERVPGERFTSDEGSRYLTNGDLDIPHEANWNYVGTFDNDATYTQLVFLAKVIAALPADASVKYRTSFLSGLKYIFDAQYPNGGWPQVWPLEGGYHDAITFNDDAMLHALELLNDIVAETNTYAFVPQKSRELAAASFKRGLQCTLAAQIKVKGRRTVWCQQNDALTLAPTSARNYEMPSASAGESATMMLFLMKIPNPSKDVAAAVNGAAAWFKKTAIYGYAFKFTTLDGRQLVSSPGSGPIWARYYDIGTDRPIFGDRDKTIHDQVREISAERRKGYSWYGDGPKRALEHYETWRQAKSAQN